MYELSAEQSKQGTSTILSTTWKNVRQGEEVRRRLLLFGIAKKPIGIRASQCAWRMEFFTFPGEMYNG